MRLAGKACRLSFLRRALTLLLVAVSWWVPSVAVRGDDEALLTVYRDRRLRDVIPNLERLAKGDRTLELVTQAQRVLEWPTDSFEKLPDGSLGSVKGWTRRLIANAPGRLTAYRRTFDPAAEALRSAEGERASERIASSYFLTTAGREAAAQWAGEAFDRGDIGLASGIWNRLRETPAHWDRLNDLQRLQAQAAWKLDPGRVGPMEVETVDQPAAADFGKNGRVWSERLENWETRQREQLALSDWLQPGGAVWRGTNTGGDVPGLRPIWTVDLLDDLAVGFPQARSRAEALDEYQASSVVKARDAGRIPATASQPICVGTNLIFRDLTGLQAVDLTTGQSRWRVRTTASLSREFQLALDRGETGQNFSRGLDPEEFLFGDSSLGLISSDGQRVFAVDRAELKGSSRPIPGEFRQFGEAAVRLPPTNRLLALSVYDGSVVWEAGTPAGRTAAVEKGNHPPTFEGHYFLGAPLVTPGRLYVLSEDSNRQIVLSAVEPATGGIEWQQPLAYASRPVNDQRPRFFTSCQPALSQGILVCATKVGVMVAVDLVTRELLWSKGEEEIGRAAEPNGQNNFGNRNVPPKARDSKGGPVFQGGPVISGERVLSLPEFAENLKCYDLKTGGLLWSAHREEAQMIGGVTAELVVLVSGRKCRAVRLSDGGELWERETGLPAGRGVIAGRSFLIPLDEGHIVSIDLKTGERSGRIPISSPVPVGNLIASHDRIISLGVRHLAVFPEARAALDQLAMEPAGGEGRGERQLRRAELLLSLGRVDEATRALEAALASPLSETDRGRATTGLRETLYQQLAAGSGESPSILRRLGPLSPAGPERFRWLVWKSDAEISGRDWERLRESVGQLIASEGGDVTTVPGEEGWTVSTEVWLKLLQQKLSSADGAPLRAEDVSRAMIDRPGDLLADEWMLHAWPESREKQERRLAVAREHLEKRQFHRAEMQLLAVRNGEDPDAREAARRVLAAVYDRTGFFQEAARLASEGSGWDVQPRSREFPALGELTRTLLRDAGNTSPIRRVSIDTTWDPVSDVWADPDRPNLQSGGEAAPVTRNIYVEPRRPFSFPDAFAADFFLEPAHPEARLTFIDRASGASLGSVTVPSQLHLAGVIRGSALPQVPSIRGHYLPTAVPGEVWGFSLFHLADGPVWKSKLFDRRGQSRTPTIGLATAGAAIFQNQHRLYALDPGDGHLLWSRQLDGGESSAYDAAPYVFGDERVLVVRGTERRPGVEADSGPDPRSYVVYDTQTGAKLRAGRLEYEPRQAVGYFGRKLLMTAAEETGGFRLRLWDPLGDRVEFDEAMGPRPSFFQLSDHELALVNARLELLIYDTAEGRVKVRYQLSEAERNGLSYLRAFRQGDYYLVGFQRNVQVVEMQHFNSTINDSYLPLVPVRDDLLAFRAADGGFLWQRSVPNRSILRSERDELPFLIMLSGVRDRDDASQRWMLVEAIDLESGEMLGRRDFLPVEWGSGTPSNNRLLSVDVDRGEGRVTLRGLRGAIHLRFHRSEGPAALRAGRG